MKKKVNEPLKRSVIATMVLTLTPEEIHNKIQKKAFKLFKKRAHVLGNDWDDWFEAERIVMSELKNS